MLAPRYCDSVTRSSPWTLLIFLRMPHPTLSILLIAFLLLVMPVWGWLDMRRLKRDQASVALMRSYIITISAMWLIALLCSWLLPPNVLWHPPTGLAANMRVDVVPTSAILGVAVGLLIGLIAPVIIVRRNPGAADKQLDAIRFLLPKTPAQRWVFVLVCLTAGIAEEWIYRGFVLHFLVSALPSVNGWLLVLAAAAMFGVAHAYQGRVGTVLTGVLGFVFSLFYIGTGSLLLSMILHALLDLRIFLLLPNRSVEHGFPLSRE